MKQDETELDSDLNRLIYGKDPTEKITAVEVKGNTLYIFKNNGEFDTRLYKKWMVTRQALHHSRRLEGDLYFKYLMEFTTNREYFNALNDCKRLNIDKYVVYNDIEAAMQRTGITLFKNLKLNKVPTLAFDIETTGLTHDENARVLIISNTFIDKDGNKTRKLFSIDNYVSDSEMIDAWSVWLCHINPAILVGHNIFKFDLPYLNYRSFNGLKIGKLNNYMEIEDYVRLFRKDGSQSYDYQNINVFGRQVIDTWFLAMKYDNARKYQSYSLKNIIAEEGLEIKNRQHYDASLIAKNWSNEIERKKIKEYAMHDADDALALYYLMIPSYFYYARSIPKTLQWINNSATGSQINSFLNRSYLQINHSIPAAKITKHYEGAISIGNPGVYYNLLKVDVSSLYPSIIRTYKVYDEFGDPKQHFLKMVEFFTEQRLKNKAKANKTGIRHYTDLEQSQKLVINSAYGMLGANKLNFNSPDKASFITKKGREILKLGMKWVKDNNYTLVNVDTDSFTYTKNREVSQEEFNIDIDSINSLFPKGIVWEDDGMYDCGIILKAKNYILSKNGKYKYKGSAIRDQKKEPALREMIERIVTAIMTNEIENIVPIYNEYAKEIMNIKDISRWASKKTVTPKLLNGEGEAQIKLRDSISGELLQQGDKFYVYPAVVGETQQLTKGKPQFYKQGKELGMPKMKPNRVYKLIKHYDPLDVDTRHLMNRLYSTIKILENILDINMFINYSLKIHKHIVKEFKS